jgi:hypothetical protein
MAYLLAFGSAALVVAVLGWWYTRLRAGDRVAARRTRTVSQSMLSSRAKLIDGLQNIPVALSLYAGRVQYQNADLDASIDVRDIDEVEYSSDLMTGGIADGAMLRLRSHGRAFEFVLDVAAAEHWSRRLPPHRV